MIKEQVKNVINGLPEGWQWVKLGDVCHTTSGGTPSRREPKYYKGNIPWVKSGELDKGIITDTEEKISEEAVKSSSAKIFPKGTLLIALYGATIGKLAFLGVEAATNQAICGIYKNDNISSSFLYNYLFYKKQKLVNQGIGGAQPNISQTILKNLDVPLPPLAQQQQIVSKIEELFSELDKGIEELKTAQQQLKVYRQAVLKSAFEGKLTNDDMKEGELPERWKLVKLKDITLEKEGLRRGPFGSAIKKSFFVPDGYKVYEQGNAINDDPYRGTYFLDEEKYQELINFKVAPHDLIVSCSGVTLGRISEIPMDAKPGVINQALLRIRLKHDIILNKYFIKHFRSAFFQKKIFDQSQGTAMPNLVGIKDFKEIEMRLPTIEEQQQIVQEIESRLSVCDKIEETITNSLKQAEALRQSILKKAFEGKLVY
jgi:type I restriction enzyme S subunit